MQMANALDHYEQLLAEHYSWMFGDFDARAAREQAFFVAHDLCPAPAAGARATAVDLGAGSGHQTVALARLGWRVVAIDASRKLLAELRRRTAVLDGAAGGQGDVEAGAAADVNVILDDLCQFRRHLARPVELITCMGDTLTHLASVEQVRRLFGDARSSLAPGGALALTFRDLSLALEGTDRFIPVRADENTILTCFLEYLPAEVRVHDLLYRRDGAGWRLEKSFYSKLRLARADVERWLVEAGFTLAHAQGARGLVEIVARTPA
jgi:SAM-dependent methyltransferase